MKYATPAATVNQRPFPVFSDPNTYRFHYTTAKGRPVTGLVVQMKARQAVGTVVSMMGACTCWQDMGAAYLADESLRAAAYCFFL